MKTQWPAVRTYCDILVRPASRVCDGFEGGPLWSDWVEAPLARHHREGRAIDVLAAPCPPTITVPSDRPYFWVGPIISDFGHFVAEFAPRILPSLVAEPGAVLVFASYDKDACASVARAPAFLKELLAWHGVPADRVHIVTEPTLFRRLQVAPQAERLGNASSDAPGAGYLARLQQLAEDNLGPCRKHGTVFVSRAGQLARFCGEAYLEAIFRHIGARVIRPEALPLREQIRAYAEAETLVFSEGSAVYGAGLLGDLGKVVVLSRRPGPTSAARQLGARAQSVTYVPACRDLVAGLHPTHYGTPSGKTAAERGFTVLDAPRMLDELRAHGIDLKPAWSERGFRAAEREDFTLLVHTNAVPAVRENPRSLRLLLEALGRLKPQNVWPEAHALIRAQADARNLGKLRTALHTVAWLAFFAHYPTLAAARDLLRFPRVREIPRRDGWRNIFTVLRQDWLAGMGTVRDKSTITGGTGAP